MLRRWGRGVLGMLVAVLVVGASLGRAAAPAAMLLGLPGLTADLGVVRIEVKF